MNPTRPHIVSVAVAFVVVAAGACGTTLAEPSPPSVAAQEVLYPTDYVWRDIEGEPLPFQDHATICEVLRTAPIVESKMMNRGVAGNIKLVLDHEGTKIHAVLRVINRNEREETTSARMDVRYRDSYIFEVGAYKLDRMFGIGRIPPAVERRVKGQPGSVQIWMEGVTPEDVLLAEDRLRPPDPDYWWRQKAIMWVFDALIANTDRNRGNLLIDEDWNLWFIDHTRAFRETSVLIDTQELNTCERGLWKALLAADEEAIRELMTPYLSSKEISRLLMRRGKLIKHFKKKIKKQGEDEVLYDLDTSS